ncbi:polysaccharide deacetylase family protein [uncultured Eudoraea sp.]|uniref:polysaccharide deacetylase family protein n=1 Tax=uncultured Eudoraea sp. TaxID=1035614 RepID=UPI0026069F0D|nr:polysaccharide deacetylase family protein [uncultured Eudoraea sp.]
MLLIYTHKITSRFSYTMRQVFTRILGIDIIFTTKVEDFIKHTGPKITYSKHPLQNEFFVRSSDLLFIHGISDMEINVENWEGTPCFFRTSGPSAIPYDIFSASFYLMTRYEEYLPYLKDTHGRFPPSESLALKHNFLRLPVIDIWAYQFLAKLKERFPDMILKERKFQFTSIVDVTSSHCYAHRGPIRSIAGLLLDIGTFKFKRVLERTSVWLNIKKDPYNNFAKLIEIQKQYQFKNMFFFQFAEYSTYDKNVSPENNNFKYLIKSVADYSIVSLAASYSSFRNIELLKEEKRRLANVINRPVNYSRMRYNRVDIPYTYRNLVEAEFTDDYTMGYTHEMGFRAGTCTPYYFYDIAMEEQQSIIIHPFAIHDYALLHVDSEDEALEKIGVYYDEVKKVNGHFVTIFSNELLGGDQAINWLSLYSKVIQNYHG